MMDHTEENNQILAQFKPGVKVKSFDQEYRKVDDKWVSGWSYGEVETVEALTIKIKWEPGGDWDLGTLIHPLEELLDGTIKLRNND